MSRRQAPQLSSRQDVDLLLLIREEEVYAVRIKNALVFSESKISRAPAPLAKFEQSRRDKRRALYTRPTSIAERLDAEEAILEPVRAKQRAASPCSGDHLTEDGRSSVTSSLPFINPDIDRRRTVDDNDAIFSQASAGQVKIEFTYADLVAAQQGQKQINARALRRLANLWDENPKLNKEEMLSRLIGEYARRYPEEVHAHEKRHTSRSAKKIKRRGGGRRRR